MFNNSRLQLKENEAKQTDVLISIISGVIITRTLKTVSIRTSIINFVLFYLHVNVKLRMCRKFEELILILLF